MENRFLNSHNNKEESSCNNTVYILLLDDSQFILNNLEHFLKKNLLIKNFNFVIKKSSSFFEFLNELNILLRMNYCFEFLILDFNVGGNLTGLDCAKLAIDVYNKSIPGFNEEDVSIFFLTEELEFYENFKNKYKDIIKSDQVFNKSTFSNVLEKIVLKLNIGLSKNFSLDK